MFYSPFIVPVTLFIAIAAIAILRGPLGKALADRIAGRTGGDGGAESSRVLQELAAVRERLAEVEERLDFNERLLAKARDAGQQLGPGA
ncbi:MAG: hypothetical protein ACREL9_01860 [Gemmatimonadales bacterium]